MNNKIIIINFNFDKQKIMKLIIPRFFLIFVNYYFNSLLKDKF